MSSRTFAGLLLYRHLHRRLAERINFAPIVGHPVELSGECCRSSGALEPSRVQQTVISRRRAWATITRIRQTRLIADLSPSLSRYHADEPAKMYFARGAWRRGMPSAKREKDTKRRTLRRSSPLPQIAALALFGDRPWTLSRLSLSRGARYLALSLPTGLTTECVCHPSTTEENIPLRRYATQRDATRCDAMRPAVAWTRAPPSSLFRSVR